MLFGNKIFIVQKLDTMFRAKVAVFAVFLELGV
jgi:hypothetical protein